MYFCRKCKADFNVPLKERLTLKGDNAAGSFTLLCPLCGNDNIDYIKPSYCGFCGQKLNSGKKYCSDICRKTAEKYAVDEEERKKKITDFDVSKAIKEVDTYNKVHNTNYSYGNYFCLKGQGKINVG